MPTLTAPRKSVKTASKAPRPFSCSIVSLTIEINDARYSVDATDPGEFGTKSFRLTKHGRDSSVYDVILGHDGLIHCDCPDHTLRREGLTAEPCKHGKALATLGLLAGPLAPTVNRDIITVDGTPTAPLPRVPDEFDAPAVGCRTIRDLVTDCSAPIDTPVVEPPAPAPCCEPTEPAPCAVCVAISPTQAGTVGQSPTVDPAGIIPRGVVLLPPEADPFLEGIEDGPAPDPESDPSDPSSWPSWCDDRWELGPDVEPVSIHALPDDSPNVPTMAFPDWIALQASAIRSYGTDAAAWLAGKLDDLAGQARALQASNPKEFDARDEVLSLRPSHLA